VAFWLTQREASLITPSIALSGVFFSKVELAVAWRGLRGRVLAAEAAFIQEAASSKQVIQIFMALANFVSSPVLDNVEFKSNASIVPVADAFII
jgi:hypothetical protein